jgi:hypothetical protein
MEMYLQFGHGMMAHTRELIRNWAGGTVVLSPRDLEVDQMQRLSSDVIRLNGQPLLDPQCYVRTADHHRLITHAYYQIYQSQSTNVIISGGGAARILRELAALVLPLGITRHILPGLLGNPVDEAWFAFQERIIEEAPAHFGENPVLATVALSAESMADEDQVEAVVERAAQWQVDGFYVIAENPLPYFTDNPLWLANLLILCAGLRLLDKRVIVGYCSHQMLCLAVANVNGMCSGTWLNVRSFSRGKFMMPAEDDVSRRAVWYYCPHALAEYRLPFLDLAKRMDILDELRSAPNLGSTYADPLFAGPDPSIVNWGEQRAFRHYLTCLHSQARRTRRDTYENTLEYNLNLLTTAETAIRRYRAHGIYGQNRDFDAFVDVNRGALTYFDRARGHQMRRRW